MDEHACLEVLIVSGKPSDIQKLANGIKSIKGIEYAELVMAGQAISKHSHHHHHK